MTTTAPANIFFGTISKHSQGGTPTYVWMCVIVQSPVRIYVHTQPMRQTNICMDVFIVQNPDAGALAIKAPANCFLYRIPYRGLRRQKRRPYISLDLCPHTTCRYSHTLIDSPTNTDTHARSHICSHICAHLCILTTHTSLAREDTGLHETQLGGKSKVRIQ